MFYTFSVHIHTACNLKHLFFQDVTLCKVQEELIPYPHHCEKFTPVFTETIWTLPVLTSPFFRELF